MLNRGKKSKSLNAIQNFQLPVLITFFTLFLILIVLFFNRDESPSLSIGILKQKSKSFETEVEYHPTLGYTNGTSIVWQIPDSPKAVIFVAHGCNGQALNFWDRSSHCPKCVGLPEERLIVLHALARNFAVLTISSVGRCWTFGKEIIIVKDIINRWVKKNKLQHLPLVAMGASSGGYFVSVLANLLKFSSITLMISEGMFDQMDIKENYPPTLFVHMPKDVYRQQKIEENMELLRNKGVDASEVECIEFPLSPHLLADRIPGLNQSMSAKLYELFRREGFIDENGYMKKDGRKTRWREALIGNKIIVGDEHLNHHIQEELNLAYAYHEMISLQSDQIFKWFESHMS